MSFVWIALLILDTDLDGDTRNISQVRPAERVPRLDDASANGQDLRLAQREIDIDRVVLDDGCERGWSGRTDEIADIDLMIGDDAVEGREDRTKAEVDVRGFEISLINGNGSLVLLDHERLIFGLLRSDGFLLLERLVAGEIDLRRSKHGLVFRQLRFRLIDLRLIGVALDAEELRSLGDGGTILVVNRFQVAL